MEVPDRLTTPLARVGVWLPLGTLVGFAGLAGVGLVAFPNAVLAVTLLAALGWVTLGFSGGRIEGPLDTGEGSPSEGMALSSGVVIYLSVTTALGWAVVLLVFL